MKVYFDNAATTQIHPKVIEVINKYLKEEFGNPSSIHSFGRRTRVLIEESRDIIANFIGADPSEIYFTSGGTEANNFTIFGIAKANFTESKRNKIIVSKAEHHSVYDAAEELNSQGFDSEFVGVDKFTKVNANKLDDLLDDNTSLISLIHINNETGSINEIASLAEKSKKNNIYIHTDAVQSLAKIPINVKDMNVDSLTASAHKINGPKGIGFTYVKSGTPIIPLIYGGSQERNRRGGTENVAAIAGFAEAIKIAESKMGDNYQHVKNLKNAFVKGIQEIDQPGIRINGGQDAIPYILSITFISDFYRNDAEAILIYLDIHGIAVSNGAACTSGTFKPSHVILASGYSEEDARGTIRFSFSAQNTLEEVNYTLDVLNKLTKKIRK
ncbi:MAG: cysteine desulfurase family protein [Melioribacteraceae bacterium]|nr:cysteine desulfurase family protein [Melioribacteraceae bacterium]